VARADASLERDAIELRTLDGGDVTQRAMTQSALRDRHD
jgi:hypothetical protein